MRSHVANQWSYVVGSTKLFILQVSVTILVEMVSMAAHLITSPGVLLLIPPLNWISKAPEYSWKYERHPSREVTK